MKNYITFAKPDDCVLPYEKPHRALARRAASEGIVLLENDGSLPLTPGNIALYGAGAAMTIKGGTGSGEVNERYSTSIMEGLESSGFQITTKAWIDDYAKEYAKTIENLKKEINSALKKLNFSAYMGLFLQSMLYP